MKSKIVATMISLGLVSCPVFAATHAMHKHHRPLHKRTQTTTVEQTTTHTDYKDMGGLQAAPVEVCTVSQAALTLDQTNQNLGRAMPNACNPGWFNRIQVSGGINVDLGKWGNRTRNYAGENLQRLSLNDAYVNVAANVNDWVKAFASLSYGNPTTYANNNVATFGEYSAAYANNINGSAANLIQLEQAYATVGNFDVSPIYVQFGKQFQDFGRYELHPITRSMTQVMSETLATSAKVGFIIPAGFHGSLAMFDDPINKFGKAHKETDYVAAIGFDQVSDQLGWGVGLSYIHNMFGVNDIAYNNSSLNSAAGYRKRVGGYAAYGNVNSGPFNVTANYTTSASRFSVFDLPSVGSAGATRGAKPWAFGLQAGYGFEALGYKNNNFYVGYQASGQAVLLDLPKNRWVFGLSTDVWKNASLGVEWDRDRAYSSTVGSRTSNVVSLRGSVQFG